METKEFLSEVLSDSGWYCLFGNDTEKDRRTQKFYATINELVDESYILDQQGYDVYFALATFREKGSRKVENVQNLKSLFLDLDCGPSKDFTTQKEAIDKLRKFVRDLKLPKPLMVRPHHLRKYLSTVWSYPRPLILMCCLSCLART